VIPTRRGTRPAVECWFVRSAAEAHRENKEHGTATETQTVVSSEAIAVLLSAGVGSGIGWIIWLATGNVAVAIGVAGPMAALMNQVSRRLIR
jgi:hypothetical protein